MPTSGFTATWPSAQPGLSPSGLSWMFVQLSSDVNGNAVSPPSLLSAQTACLFFAALAPAANNGCTYRTDGLECVDSQLPARLKALAARILRPPLNGLQCLSRRVARGSFRHSWACAAGRFRKSTVRPGGETNQSGRSEWWPSAHEHRHVEHSSDLQSTAGPARRLLHQRLMWEAAPMAGMVQGVLTGVV